MPDLEILPPSFDDPDPEPPSTGEAAENAAEPEAVRNKVRRQAKRQRDRAEYIRAILSTEEGREEMWSILTICGTFETRAGVSANGGHDPVLTAYHQGQKAIGQHLFAEWLGLAPAETMQMMTEHHDLTKNTAKAVKAQKPRPKTRA